MQYNVMFGIQWIQIHLVCAICILDRLYFFHFKDSAYKS